MERAELALELEEEVKEAAKGRMLAGVRLNPVQNSAPGSDAGKSRQAIAQIAGVSHDTIAKAKVIRDEGIPEIHAVITWTLGEGDTSFHAALCDYHETRLALFPP